MGGSGGGNQTTNTTATPWIGAQPHLTAAYDAAKKLFEGGGPQFYQGQTYADPNALERQAQQMSLDAAGQMQGMGSGLASATMSALNAPDVANNPYVNNMADTVQQRMMRDFTQGYMPAMSTGFSASGGLGSDRHRAAMGAAAGQQAEAVGGALSQLYGNAYSQGLDAQSKAIGLSPQSMQAMAMPGQTVAQQGAFNRQFDQMAIGDEIARYNANQLRPQENLDAYLSRVSGAPWGTSSTMTGAGGGGNPFAGALGGGLTGASLGSMLGPAGSMAMFSNPVTMPFALGGAILGGLFS